MFYIYKLTSPSGRSYVGFTGQTVKVRWGQHARRAARGAQHPLSAAIRKYGAGGFEVETLSAHDCLEAALAAEVEAIAALDARRYNLSPGGEMDWASGHARMALKRQDPEYDAAYRASLSAGVRASEAHAAHMPGLVAAGTQWRIDNPREAWKVRNRATRVARKLNTGRPGKSEHKADTAEKISAAVKAFWANAAPSALKRRGIASRRAVTQVWAGRGEETRKELGQKISATLKVTNALRGSDEVAAHEAQLSRARDSIDRKKQGAAASKGLKAYWAELKKNPEALAALMAQRAATHNAKKATQ